MWEDALNIISPIAVYLELLNHINQLLHALLDHAVPNILACQLYTKL